MASNNNNNNDNNNNVNDLVSGSAGITTDDQTNAKERRAKGEFVRGLSSARNWIVSKNDINNNANDNNGPIYIAEKGRYHLYVAFNCPWCHRVALARALLGLQNVISMDVVYPNRSDDDEKPFGGNLWKFQPNGQMGRNGRHVSFSDCTVDTVHGKKYIKEIYELAGIHDQKSVPILFDKQTNTVVNNESAEIVRMLGTAMKEFQTTDKTIIDFYPNDLAKEIDALNDWIYTDIANGSYKAGFSSNQDVYETAYNTYFDALEKLDNILRDKKFLTSDTIVTEADVRLFPPLFRHDPVYYNRFKLNKKYLWEYKHIWRWMGDMMTLNKDGMDAVSNANYLAHCKQGYFGRTGNGTIPIGPEGYPECYKNKDWPLQK